MSPADAPRGRPFERFVAWRHLRDPERRSHRMLIIGGSLMLLSVAATVAAQIVSGRMFGSDGFLRLRSSMIAETVRNVAAGVGGLGILAVFFGLLRSFSF